MLGGGYGHQFQSPQRNATSTDPCQEVLLQFFFPDVPAVYLMSQVLALWNASMASPFLRLKSWSSYLVSLLSSNPKTYLIQYLHFYNCFRNGNAQRQEIYFLREYKGNSEVCTDGHLSLGLTTIAHDFKDPHLELPWSEIRWGRIIISK